MLILLRVLAVVMCSISLAAAAQAPASAESKRGFLWEAKKGNQRVVLLGTIHVGRAGFGTLALDVMARFKEASAIAVEADTTNAQRVAASVQKFAFFGEGETPLDKRIDGKLKSRIETLAKNYGLDAQVLWRMKPWFLSVNLVLLEMTRLGLNPAQGTEAALFALAAQQGKQVVELEGIDMQFAMFDGAPAAVQLAYLEQTVRSIESGEAQTEVNRIADAWATRDIAAAERLLTTIRKAGEKGAAERFVVEKLLDGRHPKMLDDIERFGASGQLHLVAVGSLHYFGPNGLLAGLRSRGWTVTEVR
jgi:hypothetical protein